MTLRRSPKGVLLLVLLGPLLMAPKCIDYDPVVTPAPDVGPPVHSLAR